MLFVEIPATVVASLKNRCEKRLLLIHRDKEMFNREGVEDGDGNIQFNMEDIAENNIANFETDGLVNTDDKADISQTRDMASGDKNDIPQTHISSDDNFLGLSSRHYILLKISSILIVCVIYFFVSYWIEFGSVQIFLNSASSLVNYNYLRMTEFLLSITLMTNIAVQPYDIRYNGGSFNVYNATYKDATTTLDLMLSIQRSLAFGDSGRNIQKPYGKYRDLMFTSASCIKTKDYTPDEDCSTYFHGIVRDGAYNAFLESKELMVNCLDLLMVTDFLSFTSVNSTLNSESFQTVRALRDSYLTNLSDYMADVVNDQVILSLVFIILYRSMKLNLLSIVLDL